MCGVLGGVGSLSRDLDADTLVRSIRHRGPDGEGHFRNENLLLVHTRLAIIDLADGAQPMFSANGRFVVTYNGELYNYLELKQELVAKGVRFRTHSDTEVLLEAFDQWGLGSLDRLRGMFAFALADLHERRLWLVRDHFGIKPLFYRTAASGTVFGSELGAVLETYPSGLEFLPERLDFFLRYRHIPAPLTVYRDAFKVEPGQAIEVGFDGSVRRLLRYYQATVAHDVEMGAVGEGELEHTLRGSVRAHLIADVPRGVLLSGGVDSSLIAILANKEDQDLVSGYTITSDEESPEGDAASARELARNLGLKHGERDFGDKDVDVLPDLLQHFGEPFGDSSILPTYYVSSLARKDVKVALSGEGADEVFAGYPQYVRWLGGDSGLRPLGAPGVAALSPGRFLTGLRRIASRPQHHTESAWENAMAVYPLEQRHRLWQRQWQHVVGLSCDPVGRAIGEGKGLDPLTFAQDVHLRTNLPNDMLAKADVAAMHCGLEVRTPFLDVEVVALARRIPPSARLTMDWTGGARTKAPLKDLLARFVGAGFADRQKRGFEIPRHRFFQPGTRSHTMLCDMFLSNADIGAMFEIGYCESLLGSPVENSDRLFLLLALGIWWNQWGGRCSVSGA